MLQNKTYDKFRYTYLTQFYMTNSIEKGLKPGSMSLIVNGNTAFRRSGRFELRRHIGACVYSHLRSKPSTPIDFSISHVTYKLMKVHCI